MIWYKVLQHTVVLYCIQNGKRQNYARIEEHSEQSAIVIHLIICLKQGPDDRHAVA